MLPGFRHVQLVVVDGRRARAYGIGHRRPCSCAITLGQAARLAGQGVQVILR